MVFSMLFQTVKISAAGSTVKSSGLKTVYLTGSDGYPSGDGSTKEQPLHDINAAFRAAADGGTIVIIDSYVDQKGITTPEEKKLTIRGEHPSVSLTLRYGITLGSDLKFDRIKLETTSVDEEARRFYVNGYSLTLTDTVQCFVNENDNQKAYIYAGSPDTTEVSGRRARIDVGGGNFAGIYGYGKNGAKVLEGTEVTIRDNALTDRLDTASVVNIYTKQNLREAARNIDLLNIAAPLNTYNLFQVKNVTLSSILTMGANGGTTLEGNLNMKGDANLDISSDLYVKGTVNGSGTITPWFRGQVVSERKDSDGRLSFSNDVNAWEMRTEETSSGKRWFAAPKNKESVYFIDGTSGNDGNTGESADQAFASVQKALEAAKSGKQNISLIISGDTTVDEPLELSLPGHTFSISGIGSAPAKLTVSKPLTIREYTEFSFLTMDFTGCAGQDGIVIDTDMAVFEDNLTMEGTPPNIKYIRGEGTPEQQINQQIDIFSGTYGNINGENKEAFLILHNGNIQGKISGWGYINAAPEEWNNDAVFVGGGIESSGWLTILGGTQSFTVDGDIKAGSLETDGQEANLQITSGSQITVKDFDPQVSITVLPKQGMISEGIYVTADSFVGNTEISRVRLKNTKGYVLPVQKSGEKYIGTLKEAPQLDAPRKITWDEKGFGELTWEKVPGASRYLVTVFKGDEEILTDEESSTESLDCSKDLSRYGKGGYKAAVQAVSDTGEYSDSDISYSDLLSYHVKASSIILSPNAKELIVGETFQLKARALPFDADCGYQWTSSDISVADVDDNGNVTAVSPGTASITAKVDDGSEAASSCQVTVKPKPVERIVLSQTEKTLYTGEKFTLGAEVQPQDAADKTVKWSSSAPKTATVNSEGEITALSPGQTVVTAEANDGSKVSASCQITVKPKPAEKIVLSQTEKTLYAGESFTLGAEVQPQDATNKTVKWSSSDPKVAAVNSTGKVTALSQGQAEVTAEANDGSKVKASCQITVKVRLVEKVVLSEAVKEVYAGESFALGAEVQPQDATDKTVKWSSSDPKVAAVNRTGKVTALSQGRAVVTAKANDGSGIKASCNIIVSVRSYSIEYVLNGGRNHRDNPSEFSNTPVRLKAPARDGYLFAGWYADAGFRSKVESVTQKRECRLYAKWQKIALSAPKLTSMKNPLGPTMTVNYSKVPGAAGYEISVSPNTGFSKSSTKRWETAAGGKTLTGLKKNTVYYVRIRAYRWDSAGRKVYGTYSSKTKGYTVKYRLNKGKNNNANMISYYNIKVPLKNPSRKGYRFKGWYTSKKYKKRIKTIPKGKRANYTLYAKWKKK